MFLIGFEVLAGEREIKQSPGLKANVLKKITQDLKKKWCCRIKLKDGKDFKEK